MDRFLYKFIVTLVICILPNTIIGVYRLLNNDQLLLLNQNLDKENMIFNYKIGDKVDTFLVHERQFDLSKEIEYLDSPNVIIYDKFGFSNYIENSSPDILLIGDSYFHDPGNGTINGFQKRINGYFHNNCCYNIGAVMCSNFKVYNELLNIRYFTKQPKTIVLEIAERNFYKWNNLYRDLIGKKYKTTNYNYYGLDFLFGNNLKNISQAIKKDNKNGNKTHYNNDNVLFLNNKLTEHDSSIINESTNELVKVNNYFKSKNINLVVVIVPDKESLYPGEFGKSR